MKKVILTAYLLSCISLSVSVFYLIHKTTKLTDTVMQFERKLGEYQEYLDLHSKEVADSIRTINETDCKNSQEILQNLSSIRNKTDAQFSKTVSMSRTYQEILEEQKKATVDIAAKDNALSQMKENAEEFYLNKNYAQSYEECKKYLMYQGDDMRVRLLKAKSLYYMNKSDSSKYSEIASDINTLKINGFIDEELLNIEECIKAEMEGLHE